MVFKSNKRAFNPSLFQGKVVWWGYSTERKDSNLTTQYELAVFCARQMTGKTVMTHRDMIGSPSSSARLDEVAPLLAYCAN